MINYKNYHEDFEKEGEVESVLSSLKHAKEDQINYIGTVNYAEVYIRSKPSKESEPITTVKKDSELMVINSSMDGWYEVMLPSGVEGYIMSDFLTI